MQTPHFRGRRSNSNLKTNKTIKTDTQTHRHTDTETQRHRDTETQRHRDTEIQRHRDTDTQTHKHTNTTTDTHTHSHTHTYTHTQTLHKLAFWFGDAKHPQAPHGRQPFSASQNAFEPLTAGRAWRPRGLSHPRCGGGVRLGSPVHLFKGNLAENHNSTT